MTRRCGGEELEREWATRLSASHSESWRELTANWHEGLIPPAIDCAMAADHALDVAALLHLLGKPAVVVRLRLQRAANAFALLFEASAPDAISVQTVSSDGKPCDAPSPGWTVRSPTRAARWSHYNWRHRGRQRCTEAPRRTDRRDASDR